MKDCLEKARIDILLKIAEDPGRVIVDLSGKKEKRSSPKLVFYINAHSVCLWWWSKKFRKVFKEANCIYADGWGGVLFLKILGLANRLNRATAPDFFDEFCRLTVKKNLSLYFLGGRDNVIREFVKKIKWKHPRIKIGGSRDGYFEDDGEVIREVNNSRTDILIVGMGSDRFWGLPKQEKWSVKNGHLLKVKTIWCVGSLYDNYGKPRTKGKWYFEWWQRIKDKPGKMIFRYIFDLLSLLWIIFRVICRKINKKLLWWKVVRF